jgi:hypothetical protein
LLSTLQQQGPWLTPVTEVIKGNGKALHGYFFTALLPLLLDAASSCIFIASSAFKVGRRLAAGSSVSLRAESKYV